MLRGHGPCSGYLEAIMADDALFFQASELFWVAGTFNPFDDLDVVARQVKEGRLHLRVG